MIAPKKWFLEGGQKHDKHVNAGRSIIEIIWEELDAVMDRLMEEDEPDVDHYDEGVQYQSIRVGDFSEAVKVWGETRGQAQGLAYAIAVYTNPYLVNVPAVKEMAVERWEERHAG